MAVPRLVREPSGAPAPDAARVRHDGLALDVWVEPDGTWSWKDEDDFADAQALDVLDEEAAAAIRVEGERVIRERPWPTGWEDWRPDPEWEPPSLPEGWEHV